MGRKKKVIKKVAGEWEPRPSKKTGVLPTSFTEYVVFQFGGYRQLAAQIELNHVTVYRWLIEGMQIPDKYMSRIIKAAARLGILLDLKWRPDSCPTCKQCLSGVKPQSESVSGLPLDAQI